MTTSSDSVSDDLADEMLSRYFDGDLSGEEERKLSVWLRESPANAVRFVRQARLDYLLWSALKTSQPVAVEGEIVSVGGELPRHGVEPASRPVLVESRRGKAAENGAMTPIMLAALLLMATLGGLGVWTVRGNTVPNAGTTGHGTAVVAWSEGFEEVGSVVSTGLPDDVARITGMKGARWLPGHERHLGEWLPHGLLRLQQGTVRLVFAGGVVASVVGPAEVHLLAGDHARLIAGTFVAYAPEGAEGFRLDTPGAEITDLGTEFGASVTADGETNLSVFDGAVELVAKNGGIRDILSQGQGAVISADGTARPQFFLMPFEEPRDAIRGYRIIWEPFGPGSATGEFPGAAGAGWRSAWQVNASPPGKPGELVTVTDRQPLHPGAEWYLVVTSEKPVAGATSRLQVRRAYGSVDAYSVDEPYTIECLVRVQSNPAFVDCFEIAGFAGPRAGAGAQPQWSLQALSENTAGKLQWKFGDDAGGPSGQTDVDRIEMPVGWWEPWRVCVTVDPPNSRWRFMLASPHRSWASGWKALGESGKLPGDAHEIVFTARGETPYRLSFAIDELRIRNLP